MTFGRTVKKAMKRREEIWPGLPFDMPDNWTALTDVARPRLRQKHVKDVRKHEIKIHTHWMTLAQDRGSWGTKGHHAARTKGAPGPPLSQLGRTLHFARGANYPSQEREILPAARTAPTRH